MAVVHIASGDAAADRLRAHYPEARIVPFTEALVEGSVRSGVDAAWLDARVTHLAVVYGLDEAEVDGRVRRLLGAIDEVATDAAAGDTVLAWFDDDLFCQVNLLFVLQRLAAAGVPQQRVRLAPPGASGSEDAAGLDADAQPEAPLELARTAWQAYAAPDPGDLLALLAGDALRDGMPHAYAALTMHLRRFPWTPDGLGEIERTLLARADDNGRAFGSLFGAWTADGNPWGLGDWQAWNVLRRMAGAEEPLVEALDGEPAPSTGDLQTLRWARTPAATAVLAGTRTATREAGSSRWLGGVDMRDGTKWSFDPQRETLVAS